MSAPSKAIELQLQVKQNAEELQDFMRELESWEKDIKEVDSELRKQSGVPEEVRKHKTSVNSAVHTVIVFIIIMFSISKITFFYLKYLNRRHKLIHVFFT